MVSGTLTCLLGVSGSIETDWVSTFSPFGFGGSGGGGSLPIKLVSFNAALDRNMVKTNWITQLEINNAYFTIERSTDAENFTPITHVPGAGNSTSLLSYEAVDNSPVNGTAYYRLRQTDYDGQYSYSDIVPITIEDKNQFTFFPVSTEDGLFLNVSNPSDEVSVVIYDMTGREVFNQVYSADRSTAKTKLAIPTKYVLPEGMYVVNAISNGKEHRERVALR
jgi:hypothetical protein